MASFSLLLCRPNQKHAHGIQTRQNKRGSEIVVPSLVRIDDTHQWTEWFGTTLQIWQSTIFGEYHRLQMVNVLSYLNSKCSKSLCIVSERRNKVSLGIPQIHLEKGIESILSEVCSSSSKCTRESPDSSRNFLVPFIISNRIGLFHSLDVTNSDDSRRWRPFSLSDSWLQAGVQLGKDNVTLHGQMLIPISNFCRACLMWHFHGREMAPDVRDNSHMNNSNIRTRGEMTGGGRVFHPLSVE